MKKNRKLGITGLAAAAILGYVGILAVGRRWYTQWGTTKEEQKQPLPGDEFMDHASANHAVTINAPVEAVWPWLVQIGQDKAGFYSYTFLENIVAAGIHNSDKIVPEWQQLEAGDFIRLGSKETYGDHPLLPVVDLEKNHYLVVKGWGAFVLQDLGNQKTRMIIRSHAQQEKIPARMLRFLLLDPIHFIMERKMLLGIKERAERHYAQQPRAMEAGNA